MEQTTLTPSRCFVRDVADGTGGVRDLEELAHTYNKVIAYTDLSQIFQAERPMKRTLPDQLIGQRGSDPPPSSTPVSTKRPSLLWTRRRSGVAR
jgi:hypothetical protein